ncbi:Hypothetical Protein RradSPS_0622 [Rubrobacter radiotolerans]|uniref:Uncharacterized protein n=1 Tax=Rubrobacter radiotolerans TaxID=42256 RepID=A0A023X1L0_RUBRA|nr:hypothetical protein [Rubrobacter radiotolerans]AHY45905.1 Hypothetical Protein RradSPS_0622 [Rubrobacter radiotolerans]MDX5893319.1 hypothetical protein [Rubrobacter radiotolerans]SMC03494.1 conserved hypothetical protein [Rubrobacter radiotolerans DSM 5868]
MSGGEMGKSTGGTDNSTAYTTTAVGVGLLIAAVLVILTAGTPAAGIGFVIGAAACLGYGVPKVLENRRTLPDAGDRERELLSAIRENDGSITPTEAALETSLTVTEADGMLSELASGGHLNVRSEEGSLVYSLPRRRELG